MFVLDKYFQGTVMQLQHYSLLARFISFEANSVVITATELTLTVKSLNLRSNDVKITTIIFSLLFSSLILAR
jgi:hypothetical protein